MTRFALAAALLAALPPAAAQQPPSASPATAARPPWQVDWGQYYCSMMRRPDTGRAFATAFVMIPGMPAMHIALLEQAGGPKPAAITDVTLLPAGTTFHVETSEERNGQIRIERLWQLPADFMSQLVV